MIKGFAGTDGDKLPYVLIQEKAAAFFQPLRRHPGFQHQFFSLRYQYTYFFAICV